jgi:WD40 repeat protein
VRVWDLATGEPRGAPLARSPQPAYLDPPAVACGQLADGTPVTVTAFENGTIQVWDLVAGRLRGEASTDGHGRFTALACTQLPDGTAIAVTGRRDGGLRRWDLAAVRPYGPPLPEAGHWLVSVDRYGSVQVWDLATGHPHGPRLPHGGEPPEVVCTRLPDGTPVAAVMTDEDLWVWDLTVEPTPEGLAGNLWLVGHTRSPDGDELVVTAGGEHRRGHGVQLWDAATGRLRGRVQLWNPVSGTATDLVLAGHTGEVDILDCVVLRDGTPIMVTGAGPVRAWDATGQPYGTPLPVDAGWRRALSALELPDGTLLVIHTDSSGNLQAWDMRTGRPHGPRLAGPGEPDRDPAHVVASILLPDGTPVAVTVGLGGRQGCRVRVWDLARGQARGPGLPASWRSPRALAGTRLPDGRTVVAAGGGDARSGGTVQVWDLTTGDPIGTVDLPDAVTGLAFTAPDRLVVATELDVAAYDLP